MILMQFGVHSKCSVQRHGKNYQPFTWAGAFRNYLEVHWVDTVKKRRIRVIRIYYLPINVNNVCLRHIIYTSRVPVEGKSSVCLICMKYRIIILIIIIISLGQILLSYIANTSRTHAHTRVRTHPHECVHSPPYMHRRRRIAIRCQPTVTACSAGDNSGSLAFEINTGTGDQVSPRFWVFFSYKRNAGSNWHANSWEDVLSDDTNS